MIFFLILKGGGEGEVGGLTAAASLIFELGAASTSSLYASPIVSSLRGFFSEQSVERSLGLGPQLNRLLHFHWLTPYIDRLGVVLDTILCHVDAHNV